MNDICQFRYPSRNRPLCGLRRDQHGRGIKSHAFGESESVEKHLMLIAKRAWRGVSPDGALMKALREAFAYGRADHAERVLAIICDKELCGHFLAEEIRDACKITGGN